MRNLLKKAIPFIVLGLFVLMAAFMPSGIRTWCENNLDPFWWAVLFFGCLFLFGLAAKIKANRLPSNKDKLNPKPEDISHFYPKIKQYLKTRYQSRLDQKLAKRQPVNLRRLPSDYGTSKETALTFITYAPGAIQEEMAQTFREAKGRLLLIGAPGAGKTSLLLELVLDLLETEQEALPAILNLATWTKDYADLDAWLRAILPAELGVNKALALQILLDNRLTLLFDGFDEVKEENRQSCLEAIGKYGMDAKRRFVITSRREEYRMVEKDAPVYMQIEVGPLTTVQVEKSLLAMGHEQPEAMRLYAALQKDPLLWEAVQTPFYLNSLQLLFAGGKNWTDFNFTADTLEGRQEEIVERFADAALQVPSKQAKMEGDDRRWLGFWASRLNREGLVVFELRDLQYGWWEWSIRMQKNIAMLHGFVFGLFYGLFGGLLSLLLCILFFGFRIGLFAGLIIGLMLLFLIMLVYRLLTRYDSIKTKDEAKWSLNNYVLKVQKNTSDINFGVFFGVLLGVFNGYSIGWIEGLISVVVGSLVGGGISLLVGSFFVMINDNYTSTIQITSPYQRFIASIKSLHFSILQHFYLRWLLYRKGLLPLRLVAFLNEMTERHLLESDGAIFDKNGKITKSGATWRFRHRILQEYFAKQWKDPEV